MFESGNSRICPLSAFKQRAHYFYCSRKHTRPWQSRSMLTFGRTPFAVKWATVMVAACTCVMGTHDHKARYNPTISTSFLVGLCVSTLTGKNQPSRPWDPFSLRKASRPVPSLDGRYTGLFVPAKPRSRFGDKTCSEKQPIATLHTALLKHIQAPYIFSLDCSIDGSI